jgi:hypothetical protein
VPYPTVLRSLRQALIRESAGLTQEALAE